MTDSPGLSNSYCQPTSSTSTGAASTSKNPPSFSLVCTTLYCTCALQHTLQHIDAIMSSAEDDAWDRNNLLALLQAETPDWALIEARVRTHAFEESFLTDPLTKMNAVHYVVKRRRTAPDFDLVIAIAQAILEQNSEAAVALEATQGLTPVAICCDTAPECYSQEEDRVEELLEQDAQLITALHEENDIAMDICNKHGFTPLAVHVAALSRLMRQRKHLNQADIDVSTSPVLEVLMEKSSLQDCEKALNTLYMCNTTDILLHWQQEEDRARLGEMSEGLEGWWVLDLLVAILFAAHQQLYPGQTITNFSPLHTLSAICNVPLPFLLLAIHAAPEDLVKSDVQNGNLALHNVAQWALQVGDPIVRKSIALTTMMRLYPEADAIHNQNGETPTDIYYRTTNMLAEN